jgi:hypothetical protein
MPSKRKIKYENINVAIKSMLASIKRSGREVENAKVIKNTTEGCEEIKQDNILQNSFMNALNFSSLGYPHSYKIVKKLFYA